MTKEEIKKEIAECEERLKAEQERLADLREELDKPEYNGKRWKPGVGDYYYYIYPNGELIGTWFSSPNDFDIYRYDNCFKTMEDARFEAERRRVIAELSDFAEGDEAIWDTHTGHWCIYYSFSDKEISYGFRFMYKNAQLYFPSEEVAKAAVKSVGEERVKKYYLGVME